MVSEIKKGLTVQPNPGSITIETLTVDMLAKKDRNAPATLGQQTKSVPSSSFAAEAKGTMDMQATLRRFTVDQDLDQPDMAIYQHDRTDLEFLKDQEPKK